MKKRAKQILTIVILLIFLGSGFTTILLSIIPGGVGPTSWRAGLFIIIHGEQTEIPAKIGFIDDAPSEGFYTLDNTGIIFKGTSEDIPLGDFFKTWGKTFNSTCILEYCNNGNHSMRMYIIRGDDKVENFEYENYIVKDMDMILIDYR
jgi:hypothetical protein